MKNYLLGLFVVIFLFTVLAGCQSKADTPLSYENITEVKVSVSTGFGKVDPNYFEVYQDPERLLIFKDLFRNAVEEEGIVDMIEPEYDLEVLCQKENLQGYHLWVGETGEISTLMKVENTHTIYTVPAEITAKLIDLLK